MTKQEVKIALGKIRSEILVRDTQFHQDSSFAFMAAVTELDNYDIEDGYELETIIAKIMVDLEKRLL